MTFRTILLSACVLVTSCVTAPVPSATGITFLHLNDTYRVGAVEDGSRGGFGRVTTVIRELRADGREVRLLHGGDFLYPSLESQLWDGEQMIEAFNFLNELAPMIVVPGNHEFDRSGPEQLAKAIADADFEWLAANVTLASGRPSVDRRLGDDTLLDVGAHRVGVFALTLTPADGGEERRYLRYEDDYAAAARRSVERLLDGGADLVVGLTHLHMEDDRDLSALRAEYPQFALIAGGHEHEPEEQAPTPGRAAIVKGASNARAIWRIDVDFPAGGEPVVSRRLLRLDESVAEDAEYGQISSKWRERLLATFPFLTATVGRAAVEFDAREVTIRNEESNWGNFVADRMRTAFGDEPPADLAFINSGTLRIDDYIANDISFEDIARTFGFSSFLHYLTMSGDEFRQTLEAGYRGEGPSKGYFPQISGFRVCIDRSRPEGERIAQLQLPDGRAWAPIEGERDYLVVAPEYLVGGGDGYDFPKGRASKPGSELRYLVLDEIVAAQARGEAVGEPVDPDNPRIAFAPEPGGRCYPDAPPKIE